MLPLVDWIGHWQQLVDARAAQADRLQPGQTLRAPSHWDGLAARFAENTVRSSRGGDELLDLLRARVAPEHTLLDVGAGAGRYAVNLAPHVRRVIAVEPSAGMRAQLARQVAERGLDNVQIVASSWEEADVEQADVVLAVNVLYWTRNIAPFLQKLRQHARERCLLVLRATQSLASFEPLWEEAHGEPRAPMPAFIDLYNVLFAMGAKPDATLLPTAHHHWKLLDEAVDRVAGDLSLQEPKVARARVRDFVESQVHLREGEWLEREPTWIGLADVPSRPDSAGQTRDESR